MLNCCVKNKIGKNFNGEISEELNFKKTFFVTELASLKVFLKIMKNAFCFTLKALFVLKIFKFLS